MNLSNEAHMPNGDDIFSVNVSIIFFSLPKGSRWQPQRVIAIEDRPGSKHRV